MIKNKLSADPAALVLGIMSVAMLIFMCCCGFISPITLTLGIVGLVMAEKSLKEYEAHPEDFNPKSRSNVYIGKVLSIIGIVLSSLMVIGLVVYFAVFGKLLTDNFMQSYREGLEMNQAMDTIQTQQVYDKKWDSLSIPADTISTDTTIEK